eukprot:CAMPEP_0204529850 /NCGR_PEP_ID=MMETSP0661-20131031/10296_1 /ASSEMBLY_ACC=CAM_ASM_000606 /TAXON_ID=109239 /ORGANISM="Alexandrium margalefi, Strain AMGDE01CS-322" /LENGTH=56 /DNA_ID=CAMNT_0051535901 /DNA_START=159 /DNA_END=326 /DNA_ORIENTATION=+
MRANQEARKRARTCTAAHEHSLMRARPPNALNSPWPPCASQVLGNVLLDQKARDAD